MVVRAVIDGRSYLKNHSFSKIHDKYTDVNRKTFNLNRHDFK